MRFVLQLFLLGALVLSFSGCFRNKCGYSNNVWDEKGYYYDSQGNYRETCPDENMLIYREDAMPKSDPFGEF